MLIEQYFNKASIDLITQEDLQQFFATERQESDKLEFKAYIDKTGNSTKKERDKAKIEALIESICGFLNSDGGLLIWGAPEGKKSEDETSKEKVFKGELTPVQVSLEKDQFISKISDSISPTPLRITFGRIPIDENTFCYIIEVTKSDFTPHQYRGTYYMRLDGSTRPAPHHYVEALMKKISYPRIQAGIMFGKTRQFNNYFGLPIVVNIHNLSKTQHDRNIRYRIISTGGGIHKLGKGFDSNNLAADTDFTSTTRDLIHYKMPTSEPYYFIANRITGMQTLTANIMLTVWGELSPVLFCGYTLHFSFDPQSCKILYTLDKDENSYFFEQQSKNNESDEDVLKRSNQMSLDLFENNIIDHPDLVAFLYNK